MLSPRHLGAVLFSFGLATLSGCGSSPPEPNHPSAQQQDSLAGGPSSTDTSADSQAAADPGAENDERAGEVLARVSRGDLEEAHELLGAMLIDRHLAEARVLLDEGNPAEGLLIIDRALDLDPRDNRVLLAKGEASLQLAERGIATGQSSLFIEGGLQDALSYYDRVQGFPGASFGAAKSAWLLGDVDTALRHAREGLAAREGEASQAELRTYIDVSFSAYTAAKSDEESAEEAQRIFRDTEGALSTLLGHSPEDPWVCGKLSDLYEWEEKLGDARSILEQGLRLAPSNTGLLERLSRVTRSAGGGTAAIEALAAYNSEHPDDASGLWYEARERLDLAVSELGPEKQPFDTFQAAEKLFARSRKIEASYEASCKGYEVICRAGIGWCHYRAGDLQAAESAFLSMQELLDQGIEWKLDSRLSSGIAGLEWIGAKHNEFGDWEAAARTFSKLQGLQPNEGQWANNAGFFFRDAAVEAEQEAYRLCQAATGSITDGEVLASLRTEVGIVTADIGTPREGELLRAAAEQNRTRALSLVQESLAAYLVASELSATDVRIVNDTALILVYYTHTDVELAESLLMRCVEMGTEQLKDETLTDEARWELENAWGDAHQNLGILHANMRDDFETAAQWFARAVEIGPDPRPVLSGFWLPYLKGERELRPGDERIVLKHWAAPCAN